MNQHHIIKKFLIFVTLGSALFAIAHIYISHADTTSTTQASSTPSDAIALDTASSTAATSTTINPVNTSITTATSTLDVASTTPSSTTGVITTSTVVTGDAAAISNITNVLNVNLTDSQGLVEFLNLIAPYVGTINFSGITTGCVGCQTGNLSVLNNNSSTLSNDLSTSASSGANTVNGNGTIDTGNAFAVSNLVNIDNANFTNSNYLLVVFNTASDVNGDIVLPGKDFFNASSTTGVNADSSTPQAITNNNSSTIVNNLDVQAATGNNSSTGSGTIATGNAATAANILNFANTNVTNGQPVVVLVRVFGTWNGSVMSAPAGLYWQQTPDGLILAGSAAQSVFSTSTTSSVNTNNASVSNSVKVYALTGTNELKGNGTINTGNAAAAGNIINILNTNVVGKNVLLALVNIFGNWNGNLAFGRPDLWVGAQANMDISPLQIGEPVHYTVTVANRGSADATNVHITAADSGLHMTTITDLGDGTLTDSTSTTGVISNPTSSIYWDVPILPAGTSKTFTYTETMGSSAVSAGQFTETVTAAEHENDASMIDNTDSISFQTGWFRSGNVHDSDLYVTEINSAASSTLPGSIVHYTLTLGNKIDGGIANGVTLYQTLKGPDGKIISGNTKHIGQLYPGNKVKLSWDAQFPADASSGIYVSTDKIEAYDVVGAKFFTASSTVDIENASTTTQQP
jgi:hypothetical protein